MFLLILYFSKFTDISYIDTFWMHSLAHYPMLSMKTLTFITASTTPLALQTAG